MTSLSLAPNNMGPSLPNPFQRRFWQRRPSVPEDNQKVTRGRETVQVLLTAPGFLQDDFQLFFTGKALKVSAVRSVGTSCNYLLRVVPIDVPVDASKISFIYEQSVLRVWLPRVKICSSIGLLREKIAAIVHRHS